MEHVSSHGLYGDVSREEAIKRYPEVEDICDEEIREQVIQVIREMPDYHWTAPASSRHHPPEHRSRHGLWLHTKRVCTTFERQAKSMVKQGFLSWEEIDMGRAACILHDMYKYDIPPTSVDATVRDHDRIASSWLDKHTELPDEVVNCVDAHNGPWYVGDTPSSHLQQMVHIADLHASDPNNRVAVKEPHSILTEHFPRIEARD